MRRLATEFAALTAGLQAAVLCRAMNRLRADVCWTGTTRQQLIKAWRYPANPAHRLSDSDLDRFAYELCCVLSNRHKSTRRNAWTVAAQGLDDND